jgi:hypothetical protein
MPPAHFVLIIFSNTLSKFLPTLASDHDLSTYAFRVARITACTTMTSSSVEMEVSLFYPGWPQTMFLQISGLSKSWDYRCVSLCPVRYHFFAHWVSVHSPFLTCVL